MVGTRLAVMVIETLPVGEIVHAVLDDSPTKRSDPQVKGADIHHHPTPGPAGPRHRYGHVWLTLSLALRHPR
ncbi:MAG TPA: hypothetical protein EYP14_01010 [Planctomycetaceae bacterium]|nr:hypothetical protein [Planctomycetaceae bacterium]